MIIVANLLECIRLVLLLYDDDFSELFMLSNGDQLLTSVIRKYSQYLVFVRFVFRLNYSFGPLRKKL